MKIELLSPFYGAGALATFRDLMLPSLQFATNVPMMRSLAHDVEHRIFCTENERADVEAIDFKGVPVIIDTSLFRVGVHHHENRRVIHKAFQEAMLRETLVVVCPPDHVFGHGLCRAVLGLEPGDYLVCGHPRISLENGVKCLPTVLELEARVPNPDNTWFVSVFMNQIPHPMVEHGKRHPEPYWRTEKKEDHWETHFKEPPPLAFRGKPDMIQAWDSFSCGPLEVIDHELVEWCFQRGRLRYVTDSREFFWGELTSESIYNPTITTGWCPDSVKHIEPMPLRWYFK